MKNSKKIITISVHYYLILFISLSLSSCSDDILDEDPPHLITTGTLYTSLDGFEAGLNGIYATVRDERNEESMSLAFKGGTDNLVTNHKSSDGLNFIWQHWGDANNAMVNDYAIEFKRLYSIINSANSIINQAEDKKDIDWKDDGNKNRVIAHAKAMRAWAYRNLTYGWGDVPINLEESKGSNIKTDWERTPVKTVRKQIISDFLYAEKYIEKRPALNGRITKGAVQHYLSEMYLTLKKPDSALYWANKVIESPEYSLITERYGVNKDKPGVPFMDMFYEGNENWTQGNTEALWVWQYAINTIGGGSSRIRRGHVSRYSDWVIDGVRAFKNTYERGGRGRARQSLTKWALDLYEPNDDRGSQFAIRKYFILNDAAANAPYPADELPPGYAYGDTIYLNWEQDITPDNVAVKNWPFSRKVQGTDPNDVSTSSQYNDQICLRLANTYLLKAEAEYLLDKPGDAAATINALRRRAHASEITVADLSIDFILDERSRELVLEEDRRWTLLRTDKLLERTKAHNKNGGQFISKRDLLYPIPQVVIDANITKKMQQNPGFE
ncbi:RagB/SusD family nutrient uptake outer membrane protein [Zunongwangia endophytica]|uniref:RagB/SusD family nutrient uptake outer membrane protein n=1 Tax=Zunongwangia endophytica TaxID=1808945 RepID=A0ABV8HA97_9FLAO|nr:RagB/SusD family nutrient uptake outer membrane protein [Zunongwangia endophytica]MDN3593909.1 RagB/SusD family nutrient uptake outer membrane protein [Zunongwangia endophytica]